jgi:hypothetical protein
MGQAVVLSRVVERGSSDEIAWEQGLEGGESASHASI